MADVIFNLTDDPDQAIQKLNAAFDGTTQTDLKASLVSNIIGGGAGQIPYQSAASTTTMLAAGTSGQILQSNGTTLSWIGPSSLTVGACSGNAVTATTATTATKMDGVRARVHLSSNQSMNIGPAVKLNLNTVGFDPKNIFSAGRFTPGVGTYYIMATAMSVNLATSIELWIRKNGFDVSSSGMGTIVRVEDLVNLTSASDYIEIYVSTINSGGAVADGTKITYAFIVQIA